MTGKFVLTLAVALSAGASLLPSQAEAGNTLVIKAKSGGHGGHGGHSGHKGHRGHKYWRYGGYAPPYWYGWGGCHWKKRPHRVRVWNDYYGWHYRTVWRQVRVCY